MVLGHLFLKKKKRFADKNDPIFQLSKFPATGWNEYRHDLICEYLNLILIFFLSPGEGRQTKCTDYQIHPVQLHQLRHERFQAFASEIQKATWNQSNKKRHHVSWQTNNWRVSFSRILRSSTKTLAQKIRGPIDHTTFLHNVDTYFVFIFTAEKTNQIKRQLVSDSFLRFLELASWFLCPALHVRVAPDQIEQ